MEFRCADIGGGRVSRQTRGPSEDNVWEGDECPQEVNVEADLFEQEMSAELEERAQKAKLDGGFRTWSATISKASTSLAGSSSRAGNDVDSTGKECYDKIYFDSDDDSDNEDGNSGGPSSASGSSRRQVVSNDDLMYDPDMDDDDQAWIDSIRKQYQTKNRKAGKVSSEVAAAAVANNSDAVLNCPACFSLLCLDCQRHESYRHQYRAMFVMNCVVNQDENLKCPTASKKKKKKKKSAHGHGQNEDDGDDLFHPVKCVTCSTQVAVYDKEEIYHFFNVVASHV